MNSKTCEFGSMSSEEKNNIICEILGKKVMKNGKNSVEGMFNPTRTKLLKRFHLERPLVKGVGNYLYDADGTQYLDFLSQYGAVPFGQNHPALWQVLHTAEREQLASMVQPLVPAAAQQLAAKLAEITPGNLEVCIFTNSGAEAVEAAIKLARVRTGRSTILSTWNSFHGKTLGALSATGRPMYQKPFGAPVPHFEYVPFGDVNALEKQLMRSHRSTAAFIVEPIQGEGGIIPAPPDYLSSALALCRRYGVLSILDEIQTGLGRTGSLFALPDEAGAPDILVLAKALGGGLFPIGACISTQDAWDDQFGLLHSSTFANNNLACRVALAVIDLLLQDEQQIIRHVEKEGHYIMTRLRRLKERYPTIIKAVRGRGYMLGVEFYPFTGEEGSGTMVYCSLNDCLVALFSAYLFNVHHIVTAPMFNSSHVLRLQPPFSVGRAEIDQAVSALEALCDALDRKDYYQIVHHLVGSSTPSKSAGRRYFVKDLPRPALMQRAEDDQLKGKFAFLLHYTTEDDFISADPSFEQFTNGELERWRDWAKTLEPGFVYHLREICSAAGHSAEGWIIAVPMLPRDMLALGRGKTLSLLEGAMKLASERGARVLGLGGFTSIISRGGENLTGHGMTITSGNTLTTIMACDGVEEVAKRVRLNLAQAHTAVVGATGAIGRLASLLLANRVASLVLIGNPINPDASSRCRAVAGEIYRLLLFKMSDDRLPQPGIEQRLRETVFPLLKAPAWELSAERADLARNLRSLLNAGDKVDHQQLAYAVDLIFQQTGMMPPIRCSTHLKTALLDADLVLAATNSDLALIQSDHLKSGTVVCDVARPPNVASDVVRQRDDVLIFDGGLVQLPDQVCLGSTQGLPEGIAWGCLAETILLTLEGETRDHSIGHRLSLKETDYIKKLAQKHGFRAAPPYCHGRKLHDEDFARIRVTEYIKILKYIVTNDLAHVENKEPV